MSNLADAIQAAPRHVLISLARMILEAEEEAGERQEDWTEDAVYRALEAWAQEQKDYQDVL